MIVAGKQPALDYLTMDEAIAHCTRGIGIWPWAGNDDGGSPTSCWPAPATSRRSRSLAAAALLREHLPELRVRVVNVVDLMRLQPESEHPHGLSDREFDALFTTDRPVIFAYHGYPWLIHRLTYRRDQPPQPPRPRLQGGGHDHDAVRHGHAQRPRPLPPGHGRHRPRARARRARAPACARRWPTSACACARYTREVGDDTPDVRDWTWPAARAATEPRARPRRQRRARAASSCALLDDGDELARRARARRAARRGRGEPRAAAAAPALATPTPSATASSTAATRFAEAVPIDAAVADGAARAVRPRAAAPARSPGRPRRPSRGRCPAVPAVACFDTAFHATSPPPPRPTRCPRRGASAGRCAASASTACPTPGVAARRRCRAPRVRRDAATSAPAPRCARPRRPLGRHHDGLHAARGPRDGHPLGQRRPRPGAVAARARRPGRARARRARLEHESGLLGLPATADMREVLGRAARTTRRARSAVDVYVHRLRAGIAAMTAVARRPRRAGLHRRRRRARAADPRRGGRRASASSASRSTPRPTPPPTGDADIGRRRARSRTRVVTAREDLEIARQVRVALGG